jgi:hypothetical protein
MHALQKMRQVALVQLGQVNPVKWAHLGGAKTLLRGCLVPAMVAFDIKFFAWKLSKWL